MKFLTSMTSKVSEIKAYKPWISGRVLLFFGGAATRRLGASYLAASSPLAKIPRGSAAAKKVARLKSRQLRKQQADTSLRQTPSAASNGVGFRESELYM